MTRTHVAEPSASMARMQHHHHANGAEPALLPCPTPHRWVQDLGQDPHAAMGSHPVRDAVGSQFPWQPPGAHVCVVTAAGADGASRSENILFPCECH